MVERKPSRQRGFLFCTRVAFKHGLDWQIKNTDSLQSSSGDFAGRSRAMSYFT